MTPAEIIEQMGGPTYVAARLTEITNKRVRYNLVSMWKGRGIPLVYWRLLLDINRSWLTADEMVDAHIDLTLRRLRRRRKAR
jgi:hypothetical protein